MANPIGKPHHHIPILCRTICIDACFVKYQYITKNHPSAIMNYKHLLFAFLAFSGIAGCKKSQSTPEPKRPLSLLDSVASQDSIIYRFAFLGCNRVERNDTAIVRKLTQDPSTANTFVLDRILHELDSISPKPNAFFFLGDMVVGEQDVAHLDKQLGFWTSRMANPNTNPLLNGFTQLVAIPGNHEFLTFDATCQHKGEYPLKGSFEVWEKYITEPIFLPKTRNDLGNANFTFTAEMGTTGKKVGFVVMNTDTYYNQTPESTCNGKESYIPFNDLQQATLQLQADASITHIFAMGHKPCKAGPGIHLSAHDQIQNGDSVFSWFSHHGIVAMLSAHKHLFNFSREPNLMPQVIAGNGGSQLEAGSYGYCVVDIRASGKVELHEMTFAHSKTAEYYDRPNGATIPTTYSLN